MNLFRGKQTKIGFTLIEIMIVISIIGILAAVVTVNVRESSAGSRDAKRQADLRNLQTALETYKNKNGRYPAGCVAGGASDGWSGQMNTNYACTDGNGGQYILGLAPEYISVLPIDPKLNGVNSGYVYTTNANGTVYKIMVMRTVEAESVDYLHPLKSCDVRPTPDGKSQNINDLNKINDMGWCFKASQLAFDTPGNPTTISPIPNCRMKSGINAADNGNGRFEKSYAVWGGFEGEVGGANSASKNRNTTAVICK